MAAIKEYTNIILGQTYEAAQLTAANVKELQKWCHGFEVLEQDAFDSSKTFVGMNVLTLNGMSRLSEGQYLVRGGSGEFYIFGKQGFDELFRATDGS